MSHEKRGHTNIIFKIKLIYYLPDQTLSDRRTMLK